MATRADREAREALNKQHQQILNAMLAEPANAICVDCRAKGTTYTAANERLALAAHAAVSTPSVSTSGRSAMGVVEPRRVHVHRVLRLPPVHGDAHHSGQVSEPRHVDDGAGRGTRCLQVGGLGATPALTTPK